MSSFPLNTALENWTETQLLASLKNGGRDAFTEIYERFWYQLYRVAYQKTSSKEVAEELVQDLFVSLWQRRETLTVNQLSNYLFSSIKYSVIDFIESKTVQEKYKTYYETFNADSDHRTEQLLDYKDLHEAIEKELQLLPDKTQEIFRLSRFEHQSIPEIAKQLQIPEKTVEYHLSKALKFLRENLRDFMLAVFFCLNW